VVEQYLLHQRVMCPNVHHFQEEEKGTRLLVKNNIIVATILNGKFKGEDVLLLRIPMIPTDMLFEFKRLQFPVRLASAMTINKAQGKFPQVRGLNLENPCFSLGQLYVACSRVGKPSDLFLYTPEGKTKKYCVFKSSSITTIKTK
jgi:ATP-dependent DNA helicase PIF1